MPPLSLRPAQRTRLLAVLPVLVAAPFVALGQFTFTTNNGALAVTGYTGPGGVVVIPSTTNGLPVTSVGGHAFESQAVLTSITIPSTVTNIGACAFQSCTGLTNALLGEGLVEIDDGAFEQCARLTDVTLPKTTRIIRSGAFASCPSLTEVTIPENVVSIGAQVFYFCTSLRAITVESLNMAYSSLEGVMFNFDRTVLLQYPGGKTGTYTIPGTVTNIGGCAFMQCDKLDGVVIPSSVTSIGNYAFYYCTNLSDVHLPASLTSIGALAFSGCNDVTNFTIPAAVSSIGLQAFAYCTRLETITVAESNLTYFSVAGALVDKRVTRLVQCPGAKTGNYSVPNGVTNIGHSAFYGCSKLTGIVIPSSVVAIEQFAFCGCTGLDELIIPEGVTTVGQYAFDYCTNLSAVYFKGDAPVAGYQPFYYAKLAIVYYLPGTSGWGTLWGGVPTRIWQPRMGIASVGCGARTNQFGFQVNWARGMKVVVEVCSELGHPTWSSLSTNTLEEDAVYLIDPAWTNRPACFYRLRCP